MVEMDTRSHISYWVDTLLIATANIKFYFVHTLTKSQGAYFGETTATTHQLK